MNSNKMQQKNILEENSTATNNNTCKNNQTNTVSTTKTTKNKNSGNSKNNKQQKSLQKNNQQPTIAQKYITFFESQKLWLQLVLCLPILHFAIDLYRFMQGSHKKNAVVLTYSVLCAIFIVLIDNIIDFFSLIFAGKLKLFV